MIPLEKKEKIYEQCLVACLFHKVKFSQDLEVIQIETVTCH